MYNRNRLREIADAIRYIDGSSELINASDFEDRIKNLKKYILNIDSVYKYCIQRTLDELVNVINIDQIINNSNINNIRDYAFYNCASLALTSLPEGITSIGNYAFCNCTNLALTSLPEGITSIGVNTFYDCTNLALTSLPEGITSIGTNTFYGCTSLTTMTIGGPGKPIDDTMINSLSFSYCNNLTSITIYTSGGVTLSNAPFGATNATITYMDSNI